MGKGPSVCSMHMLPVGGCSLSLKWSTDKPCTAVAGPAYLGCSGSWHAHVVACKAAAVGGKSVGLGRQVRRHAKHWHSTLG
jgi:hypothetical protein